VNNNPVNGTDPSGHSTWDEGADYTDELKAQDEIWRQTHNHDRCENGNTTYCSYGEQHPVETITFVAVSLVGGAATATAILESGVAAAAADAALWSLQRGAWKAGWVLKKAAVAGLAKVFQLMASNPKTEKGFIDLMTRLGTNNPASKNIIIGNFPEYKDVGYSKGYTYFQLPSIVYNVLDEIDLAQRVNNNVIYDSISGGKIPFLVAPRPAGVGLLEELDIFLSFHTPVYPLH